MVAGNYFLANETRADLAKGLLAADATAAVALVGLDLVLGAATFALAADDLLLGGKLDCLALVELLKSDLVRLLLVGAASWAARATTWHTAGHAAHVHAEHLREDVVQVDLGPAGPTPGWVEGGHAVRVVEMALFLIAEDFVGLCDGLELGLGLDADLFGDLVGVVLQRQLLRVSTACRQPARMAGWPDGHDLGAKTRKKLTFR